MCHEIHNNISLSKSQRRKMEELRDWELLMVIYESHQTAVGSAEPALAGFRNVWVKPTIRVKFKQVLNMSCPAFFKMITEHPMLPVKPDPQPCGSVWASSIWRCCTKQSLLPVLSCIYTHRPLYNQKMVWGEDINLTLLNY